MSSLAYGQLAIAQFGASVPGEFGPNAIVEGFEGQLIVDVAQDFIPFDGGTLPFGTVALDHAFWSGVTVSGHSTSPDRVLLYDWSVPFFYNQAWNLASAGAIFGTTPLPSGSSYLAHDNLENGEALTLSLPVPAYRVGGYVEAWDFAPVTVRAYDAQGVLLASQQVSTDGVVADGLDSYIGISSDVPIASIELSAPKLALDDLTFDPDPALSYGRGCPGAGGVTPELWVAGVTTPGAAVTVQLAEGLGGATALVLLGTTPAHIPIGASACYLAIQPVLAGFPLQLDGTGAGAGNASLDTDVPTSLPVGSTLTLQAWVVDPSAALGASASNGVEITILP